MLLPDQRNFLDCSQTRKNKYELILLFFIEITSIFNERSNISSGFIKMTVAKLIQAYISKKRLLAKTGEASAVSTGKLKPEQTAGTNTNGTK
jgi:hypothetical protein